MIIIYGDVELHYETARICEYRAIYSPDGADFLYWHFRIGAVCEVGRYATGGISPQGTAIEALSRIMMEPGQRLTVADDLGNPFVDSPEGLGVGATTVSSGKRDGHFDLNQGPKPIVFEVLEMRPSETTRVYFECETWLARCPGRKRDKPGQVPILYHRFSENHSIDRDFFTTRTVVGEMRFRSDVLRRINRSPDDYRFLALPYIPANFRREGIEVYTDKAGLTAYYVTKDVEQSRMIAKTLVELGVTNVEAKYFSGLNQIGTPTGFPVKDTNLVIECWGSRRCDPHAVAEELDRFFGTAGFRLQQLLPFLQQFMGFVIFDHRNGFEVDLKRRYVRGEIHVHTSILGAPVLQNVRDILNAAIGPNGILATSEAGQGPVYQGTYLGKIVHQILKDYCDPPKLHARDPENIRHRDVLNVDPAHRVVAFDPVETP